MGNVLVIKGADFSSVAVAQDELSTPDAQGFYNLVVEPDAVKSINYTDGTIFTDSTEKFWHSDYVSIAGYSTLKYTNPHVATGSVAGLAFYDKSKNYISGVQGKIDAESSVEYEENIVTVPVDAVFIRFTMFNESYGLDFSAKGQP